MFPIHPLEIPIPRFNARQESGAGLRNGLLKLLAVVSREASLEDFHHALADFPNSYRIRE